MLITIHHGRAGVALRKLAVAPELARVNLRMMGAIHGLHSKVMPFAGFYFKKIIFVLVPVAAGFIEFPLGDMGNFHPSIAALVAKLPYKAIEQIPHNRTSRSPERKSRANQIGKDKKIQLGTEHLMIPFFGFFEHREILLKFFFGRKRHAVDARKHGVFFRAAPVGTREMGQLERIRLDFFGGIFSMAAATKIGVASGSICRQAVFFILINELQFVGIVGKERASVGRGDILASHVGP